MTHVEQVRQLLAGYQTASRKTIREALGLTGEQVDTALRELIRQGLAERVGHGIVAARTGVDGAPAGRPGAPTVREKMWAAMRMMTEGFAVADLARMAGSTEHYANKMLRDVRQRGWVVEAGRRRTDTVSGSAKIWRLTRDAKALRTAPERDPWQPDPLVTAAVDLLRLVATGQVRRFPGDRDRAARLCEDLAERIRRMEADNE